MLTDDQLPPLPKCDVFDPNRFGVAWREASVRAYGREVEAATLATVTPLVQQLEEWKVGDRVISDGIHRDRPATITEVFIGFRYKLDEPHHLGHRQGWITDGTVYDTTGWRKLPTAKDDADA